ncbi:transmembrane protein, putative [Rhizoctonia solani AG-3 Rhs1AP]|uniref:Transmembrane protein, putative n=2 Tax=Rhizoctonia solani AG-3 TaxID=1086053 RepID=X8JG94_9AGAM|nr:transmembrane protein, putative [Rhizoctonia solani AG-3 Rhs1AP]KEP53015.1 putative transmembrane protein [Rhizoctonia solani 123E]
MVSNGGGTGIFFVIALGCIGLFLMYWLWAVHSRRQQQRMLGFPSPQSLPHPHPRARSRFHGDPVVRMEEGENTDGLPKYTPQAAIGEQTVDRNCTRTGSNQANAGTRSGGLMSAAPSFFRQISQLPSRPPPAYDPASSPPRGS